MSTLLLLGEGMAEDERAALVVWRHVEHAVESPARARYLNELFLSSDQGSTNSPCVRPG